MQMSVRNPSGVSASHVPDTDVRSTVRNMLLKSDGFRKLDAKTQNQVASDMARVADYLAKPEGVPGNTIPGGVGAPATGMFIDRLTNDKSAAEASFAERQAAVDAIGAEEFRADAAREGAKVAGELLREVKFPAFVSGLIEGVFQSIVTSSMEQMEQYAKLISSVSKSLQQFMDDNVSENQGRDSMVDQFPDLFEIGMDDFSDTPGPKLQLRDDVDESDALQKINNSITFENGELKSLDLSDEQVEKALVHNARIQIAKQRQQMMASMVMMGINRIVVTDGRISAKILYDFRAQDRQKSQRSATAMDVARDRYGNVQKVRKAEGESEITRQWERDRGNDTEKGSSSGDYYASGKYQYEDKPIITAMSSASSGSEAQIQTKVQLAGNVSVNFKSDYLPLETLATPGMIAAIQGNSTPVDPNVIPSARQAPGARAESPGTTPGGAALPPPPA